MRPELAAVLTELARLRPAVDEERLRVEADEVARELRAWYYPAQRAFFRGTAKWRATTKTRRSGATAGGVREFLARAIEQPGWRGTYATTTRQEAHDRAWKNDNKSGLYDLLLRMAEPLKHPTLECFVWGGVKIEVRQSDLKLEFSNGSQIELFGADNIRQHRVKRGNAKHVFWIDEVQDFPHLEEFFDGVVIGSLQDYKGEAWFTGTPGKDCAGMFYEITKPEDDGDARMPNWDVHTIRVVDNPMFGRVVRTMGRWWVVDNGDVRHGPWDTEAEAETEAVKIRWENTAGDVMRQKGWKGDEPDFLREWLAQWVRVDARYVYPIHSVPRHQLFVGPQRLCDNPFVGTHDRFRGHPRWYDHHAAVCDLPRPKIRGRSSYDWLYAMYADFGYHPDPFAIGVWAFCFELPDIYEMFSWKQTRVHTDDQGAYMKLLWDALPNVVSFVGDPAGKQDDFEMWRTRMNLPIEEANKQGKNTLEEFLADDCRLGRVHLREGSPLHMEMKYLVYLPGKPGKTREVHKHRKVNGVIHGDHCCDGARYSYADLRHWQSKARTEAPKQGTPEAYAAQAERYEKEIERRDQWKKLEEMDEMAQEWQS